MIEMRHVFGPNIMEALARDGLLDDPEKLARALRMAELASEYMVPMGDHWPPERFYRKRIRRMAGK